MPDISMCTGDDCPLKKTCYRFLAEADRFRQTWFMGPPVEPDGSCKYYWDARPKKEAPRGP